MEYSRQAPYQIDVLIWCYSWLKNALYVSKRGLNSFPFSLGLVKYYCVLFGNRSEMKRQRLALEMLSDSDLKLAKTIPHIGVISGAKIFCQKNKSSTK